MFVKITVLMILVSISIIHLYNLKKTNYVYDLSFNRKCNFFEIYDIDNLKKFLKKCPNEIIIDDYLPKWINIMIFPEKGWGLVTKKPFKKNEIIYKVPILLYPEGGIDVLSKRFGRKKITKEIHCDDIGKKYGIFSYYDAFLNHSNNPSAYHDILLIIENKKIFIVLKAYKDISIDTELTINYLYLNKYIYLIKSYINLVSKNFKL